MEEDNTERKEVAINWQEKIWLNQHGGRTSRDVFIDENGKYVYMTDGYGNTKVYLPLFEENKKKL